MVARGVELGSCSPNWKQDELDAGDPKGPPIGINLSLQIRQEAERSVGAREDDVGLGGPLGSPAGWRVVMFPQDGSEMNRDAGDASVPTPHPRPLPPLRMVRG